MSTKEQTINVLCGTFGVLGVSMATFDPLGVIDGATFRQGVSLGFEPSPSYIELEVLLDRTLRMLPANAEPQVRVKLEHYTVLAVQGPSGSVAVAFAHAHPLVKSINRPVRKLAGLDRRGLRPDQVASALGEAARDLAVLLAEPESDSGGFVQ